MVNINKYFLITGIVIILLVVGLCGCNEQQSSGSNNNYEKAKQIENAFLSIVRSIGSEFKTENDVFEYTQPQLNQHKEELDSYDLSLLSEYGSYAGSYYQVRSHLIKGLEYIIEENYENAWKNILYASGELFDINTYTGDMWEIDVGLGNLKSILYDLKEK